MPASWEKAPIRPRISARQRQKEAEQLAQWSAEWHDHLERAYAAAKKEIAEKSGETVSGTDDSRETD
jgi:hypothetical protein